MVPYGPPFTLPSWGLLPEFLRGRTMQIQIAAIDVGLLFIFAITALGVYGIVLAGWAANNKYSLLGGLRSSAQMFSYELALGLSWVGVIMLAGSFQITDIVNDQGARRAAGSSAGTPSGSSPPSSSTSAPRPPRSRASPSTCRRGRRSSWPVSTPSTRRCASP